MRTLLAALRRPGVLLVLVVLETANLGMDVLALFLGLWVADGLGLGAATGAAAVSVWSVTALVSDGLAVRFHALVRRRSWMVGSAAVQIAAVVTLVLTRDRAVVLACTVVASAARAGWYPTLLAGLYRSLPGRTGVAVSLWSAFGLLGGVFPLGLGLVADHVGLQAAVALLLVGPVSVAVFAWRRPPVG